MPLLTRAPELLDSVRLDVDAGFERVLAASSSSESESFNLDLSFDLEGLGSVLGAALVDTVGGSTGSALILRVSGAGLDAVAAAAAVGLALPKKSSFPEGFGFAASSLMSGLTSFGSDLTTG